MDREFGSPYFWKNVTDQLPDDGQLVLAYYSGRGHGDCREPDVSVLKYSKKLGWTGFRVDLVKHIIKWKPLMRVK